MTDETESPVGEQLAIDINVQHAGEFVDTELLDRGIRCVAEMYGSVRGNISVGVVGDQQMQELNRQYLQHDYTTDVLSFVYDATDESVDGELILCADYASRAANEAGWEPATELALYAVHGTLHLMGLDDQTPEGRQEMRSAEREILMRLGIEGADAHREPEHWSTI